MPRFHFHLVHGNQKILDTKGRDYDDLLAAKMAAIARARDCIVEQLLQDNPHPNGRHIQITDGNDRPLAEVKFGDFLPEMKG
jgi:hypothetical protein